jgi:hypothetical protein
MTTNEGTGRKSVRAKLRPAFTLIWVVLGAAAFITEMVALFSKPEGGTLSDHMWKLLRVEDSRPTAAVWIGRGLVAIFLMWLIPHFTLGWFTPSDPVPWK